MDETTFSLATPDGIELQVYRWAPAGTPRAVVQVHHGLGEHAGRYRRFASALTDAGHLVVAPDQRASGRTAQGEYGNWGPDGWAGWVRDYALLTARIREDEPGLPVALFGHSLGSFGAQHHLLDHSGDVDAVVLSGTGDVVALAPLLAGDGQGPADLSTFNAAFEHRTGFEWLTRDEAEVDRYVADPACGWAAPPPAGIGTLAEAGDPARVARIRKDLPILLVSGDQDPVGGGGSGVRTTAERYEAAGLERVETTLYPGARHEILNETNRDEVTRDIIAFLDRALALS
ncbi:alpha/beta hydrolase [uncultured Tessaracoccus sp.]|uniref:alpha/beta hydrolase n=1 Tax=uncultured Tessaracoccus sp. TaxID=905023 RepID=UPI0025EE847F|nr:alpha/beta hydrolase [uncultured Tessaracoccus sp.]